jgi:hypothetical protein
MKTKPLMRQAQLLVLISVSPISISEPLSLGISSSSAARSASNALIWASKLYFISK